jgi:hypothetical protein
MAKIGKARGVRATTSKRRPTVASPASSKVPDPILVPRLADPTAQARIFIHLAIDVLRQAVHRLEDSGRRTTVEQAAAILDTVWMRLGGAVAEVRVRRNGKVVTHASHDLRAAFAAMHRAALRPAKKLNENEDEVRDRLVFFVECVKRPSAFFPGDSDAYHRSLAEEAILTITNHAPHYKARLAKRWAAHSRDEDVDEVAAVLRVAATKPIDAEALHYDVYECLHLPRPGQSRERGDRRRAERARHREK